MLDDIPEIERPALAPWSRTGSGDNRADRRFLLSQQALAAGDAAAAADLARQALELAPTWPPAWLLLGEAEQALGRYDAAAEAVCEALRLDPPDRLGAALRLAGLPGRAGPTAMAPAYVASLFDDYAERFERHLTGVLGYRGPTQLVALLARAGAGDRSFRRVVDLGCGTGLMGEALRGRAGSLAGCDLAPRMVAQAARRGLYDDLATADAETFLAREAAASADLVTAADMLVYVGALEPLFAAVARVLEPGGLFAFTLQTGPAAGFVLGEDLRFHHAVPYVEAVGREAGLARAEVQRITIRLDRGQPLPGAAVLCRRTAS